MIKDVLSEKLTGAKYSTDLGKTVADEVKNRTRGARLFHSLVVHDGSLRVIAIRVEAGR